ncbi:MAG: hypothetical protein SGJ15_02040, partial [Bacteroidota bacterium]|nr:hypothetical protein [Bacteroidota bacterium]
YSHNSHEKEDAIYKGAQSAEYWMYDSRIMRRWEVDPMTYEWQSPYAVFNNNPILYADLLGLKGDDKKTERSQRRADKWNSKHENTKAKVDESGNVVFYHNKGGSSSSESSEKKTPNDNAPQESDTKDGGKVVDIYIKHGSNNQYGGKAGGHVGIGLGEDVYGFTNTKHGSHLFPNRGANKNGTFEKDSKDWWSPDRFKGNVTKISIPVTDEQYGKLKSLYDQNYKNSLHPPYPYQIPAGVGYSPPYDYAIIGGRRCASSAYQSLINADVLEKKLFILDRAFHSVTPGFLLRYLRELSDKNNWDYESNFKTRKDSDGNDTKSNDYSPNLIDRMNR